MFNFIEKLYFGFKLEFQFDLHNGFVIINYRDGVGARDRKLIYFTYFVYIIRNGVQDNTRQNIDGKTQLFYTIVVTGIKGFFFFKLFNVISGGRK